MLNCARNSTESDDTSESFLNNEKNKKLAQFYTAIEMYIDDQKMAQIIKYINDINHKIPENEFFTFTKPKHIGMTALNLALEKKQLTVFNLLIEYGADYTIKNSNNSTVLHQALNNYIYYLDYLEPNHNYYCASKCQFECEYADSVLSAQICSDNSVNPLDENGISHFHIACLLNNVKAAEFFLKKGVSVDEGISKDASILPGFSPLHIAVKYWAFNIVCLLLEHNANKCIKDARGLSPLHVLVEERLKLWFCVSIRDRIKITKPFNWNFERNKKIIGRLLNGCEAYEDDPREFQMDADTSTIILDANVTDDIGLTHFHVACTFQNVPMVEKLLKQIDNVNQIVNEDSPVWAGYTPLHFAAHFDLKTVQLLIKYGANLGFKDAKGLTPFEICLQRYTAEEVCSILKLQVDWENIMFSDGNTKLFDFINAMRDENEFEEFLKNKVTDINMFIPLDSTLAAGYTPLHFVVIATEIAKTNLSNPEKADYSASSFIDTYRQNNRITTRYRKRISFCLALGVDFTKKDARGLTALHHAFRLRENLAAVQLLELHPGTTNSVDQDGISHFHIACVASDGSFINKFLSNDKLIVNQPVTSSFTCNNSILHYWGDVPLCCFIEKGSTPLHIAVATHSNNLTKILLKNNADISARDEQGLTPLDLALKLYNSKSDSFFDRTYKNMIRKIISLLVQAEADSVEQRYKDRISLQDILNNYNDLIKQEFVVELEWNGTIEKCILDDMGITLLHTACAAGDIEKAQQLLSQGADVNAQIYSNSPVWPGCTPLNTFTAQQWSSDYIQGRYIEFVQLLLDYKADVTIQDIDQFTPIHNAFYSSAKVSCNIMMKAQQKFDVNPIDIQGTSHFHIACTLDDSTMAENFWKHGVDVNLTTNCFNQGWGSYTPLHFAVRYSSANAVTLLLKHGADVHCKDIFGDTPLHTFARHLSRGVCSLDIFENLVSFGADVNDENLAGETILEVLFKRKSETKELLIALKNHGCRFNAVNRFTGEGYGTLALYRMKSPVYETMLNILEIDDVDEMGRTVIHNVISTVDALKGDVPDDIRIVDIPIDQEIYYNTIKKLTTLGVDINQQDFEGLTALHIATQRRNYSGVKALLLNGADINVTDFAGKTALAYSITFWNDKRTEIDIGILEIFLKHVYKLHLAKMTVIKVNQDIYVEALKERYWNLYREYQELHTEAVQLYDKLGSLEMDTLSFTLYEEGLVIDYSMMIKQHRDFIDEFIKESETWRQEFPEFFGLILLQYNRALARVKLIQSAEISFNILVGFEVPYLCTYAIFQFLNNEELKNVIVSSDLVVKV